jgi:pyrroline-5-carboxylate reductase
MTAFSRGRHSRLGFVGTGAITKAIVTGLCGAQPVPEEIWVSPRNADVASALAKAFSVVHVGASNQDVLDRADTIVLAIRPQIARAVVAAMVFAPHHRVISLVAAFSHDALAAKVAPAGSLTCAAPLPSVAAHRGPIAIFPPDAQTAAIFDTIGTAVQVGTQSHFDALLSCTAEMASYFQLLETCSAFLLSKGIAAGPARRYVAAMFDALGRTALSTPDHPFSELIADHMTRGGLNEQVHAELTNAGAFSAHAVGLQHAFERIQGA